MSDRLWRTEKFLSIMGITLLSLYGSARLHSEISSRLALRSFQSSPMLAASNCKSAADSPTNQDVDFTLWSEKRINAYHESLITKKDRPVGILRIPSLEIEVPVFDGTDDLTMNRGVGRIIGSARIGSVGNTALAGHRDGFFRSLKEISVGAHLDLVTPDRMIHYLVKNTEIVMPNDVSVLANQGEPSLTLVTCFPFYFVGDAPKRFIVHAKATDFYGPDGECSASLTRIKTQERIK